MLSWGNIILHSALSIQHLPQAYVPLRGVGCDSLIIIKSLARFVIVPLRGVGCDLRYSEDKVDGIVVIVPLRGVGCDELLVAQPDHLLSYCPLAGCRLRHSKVYFKARAWTKVIVPSRGVGCDEPQADVFFSFNVIVPSRGVGSDGKTAQIQL